MAWLTPPFILTRFVHSEGIRPIGDPEPIPLLDGPWYEARYAMSCELSAGLVNSPSRYSPFVFCIEDILIVVAKQTVVDRLI